MSNATSDLQAVQERFQFRFPDLYLRLSADGCYDPFDEQYLQLSDLLWLPFGQILQHRFHKQQIEGLIPFGRTAQEDLWCFYPGLEPDGPAPVVFCPDEDEVASIYAPDFEAFLYRAMLEEYACTGLTEHYDQKQSHEVISGFTVRMDEYLREDWAQRLAEIDKREWHKDANGYFGSVGEEELEEILAADLAYARLDEEFEHFIDE